MTSTNFALGSALTMSLFSVLAFLGDKIHFGLASIASAFLFFIPLWNQILKFPGDRPPFIVFVVGIIVWFAIGFIWGRVLSYVRHRTNEHLTFGGSAILTTLLIQIFCGMMLLYGGAFLVNSIHLR